MSKKQKPKTIREQIMLLPDPLNHLCIEMFVGTVYEYRLNDPAYKCKYYPNIDAWITPVGLTVWEDVDLFQAISHDAIYHKLWEEEE